MKKLILVQNTENILYILRGPPASGKSYRAKQLANAHEDFGLIYSADSYFGVTTEEYIRNWSRDKLFLAHKWCQDGVLQAMESKKPVIIVDNTNTTLKEMKPYAALACKFGYKIQIEEPRSSWWLENVGFLSDKKKNQAQIEAFAQLLADKNKETHGVPYETILAMLNRYQVQVIVEDLFTSV